MEKLDKELAEYKVLLHQVCFYRFSGFRRRIMGFWRSARGQDEISDGSHGRNWEEEKKSWGNSGQTQWRMCQAQSPRSVCPNARITLLGTETESVGGTDSTVKSHLAPFRVCIRGQRPSGPVTSPMCVYIHETVGGWCTTHIILIIFFQVSRNDV